MRIAIIRYHTLQYVMNTTHRTANKHLSITPFPEKQQQRATREPKKKEACTPPLGMLRGLKRGDDAQRRSGCLSSPCPKLYGSLLMPSCQ